MNKVEFMRQLERLLQNISEQERQEALQYYGDYFDDAGPENEQAVLEALGNPARVAENIRRDLYGAGYGDGYEARKPVTGRELTEYGTFPEEAQNQGSAWQGAEAHNAAASDPATPGSATHGGAAQGTRPQSVAQSAGMRGAGPETPAPAGPAPAAAQAAKPWPAPSWGGAGQGASGNSAKEGKGSMSSGTIALIVILCIICLPVGAGLLGGALGLVGSILGCVLCLAVAWFVMIFAFGIASVVCILAGLFVCVVGVMGMGFHPLAGLGLVGGGFIAVSIGIFFMMAAVAMAGVATPAIFRGIRWLCRRIKKLF